MLADKLEEVLYNAFFSRLSHQVLATSLQTGYLWFEYIIKSTISKKHWRNLYIHHKELTSHNYYILPI